MIPPHIDVINKITNKPVSLLMITIRSNRYNTKNKHVKIEPQRKTLVVCLK